MAERKAFIHAGREIAPCIVAKASHALGLKEKRPGNKKKCSASYWEETVQAIAERNSITSQNTIIEAISKYDQYAKR